MIPMTLCKDTSVRNRSQFSRSIIRTTDDRLIIEVVYMVFRVAIAVYLSHKVPRHLAISTHTSVLASCAFALLCADNHNNNGGIVTSPQHAQRVGSGAVQQCFLFGGAINT